MFYRHSNISEKLFFETTNVIQTMNDISITLTLSALPTKRCGLYSVTPQRTLGIDSNGHLCYWYYDGRNDKCLNGSTVLSGTNVRVGVVHSRTGVRLYVNGVLDAFAESPLWAEANGVSYIGTHALAPNDLEMDGVITGALLTDYAMTDAEMSVAEWNSELCVKDNVLFYAPSNRTMHIDTPFMSSSGSVYVVEDNGLVLSDSEKLPCWYLGEYDSSTQDITLNISEKRGGGTYNNLTVDHIVVGSIETMDTGNSIGTDADSYSYIGVDEDNNAIFTNPHINTLSVEYHSTDTQVADPSAITVWGSSYDSDFPFVYAKYSISYKDGSSGVVYTTMKDPSHQQNMIRTVTCYVEATTSTYSWATNPTLFTSYTGVSFYGRNAHAGKYQFTRQWTWFGANWVPSSHSSVPTSSIVGFTNGHWVSGSETATFVVDDDYLRNIVVVEDVVSQSVKTYATSHGQPVSSYMGKKMLPSGISGGYALSDSVGSMQAKDCYLEEIHSDGFVTTLNDEHERWWEVGISGVNSLYSLAPRLGDGSCMKGLNRVAGEMAGGLVSYSSYLFDLWDHHSDPPVFYTDYFHNVGVRNWFLTHQYVASYHFRRFLLYLNDAWGTFNLSEANTELFGRLGLQFVYNGDTYTLYTNDTEWKQAEIVPSGDGAMPGIKYGNITIEKNGSLSGLMAIVTVRCNSSMDTLTLKFEQYSGLGTINITCQNTTVLPYVNYGSNRYIPFGVVKVRNRQYVVNAYSVGFDGYLSNGDFYGDFTDIYIQNFCDAYYEGGVINGTQNIDIGWRRLDNFNKRTLKMGTSIMPETVSSVFPMTIQTWKSSRGESYMRALLPFNSSDPYVARNGSTIGLADNMWESLFVNTIRDSNSVLLRPFKASDSQQYTMFLYDQYMMVWGTNTTNGSGSVDVSFEKSFSDTNYVVVSTMNVTSKDISSVSFNGSNNRTFGWIAIGKRYIQN